MPVFVTRRIASKSTWIRTAVGGAGMLAFTNLTDLPQSLAQSGTAVTPKFEVASIRPGCPGSEGPNGPPASWMDRATPGRLSFCFILKNLINSAYFQYAGGHVNPSMIQPPHIGDPSWFESDKYMLNAKAIRLRKLCEDRCFRRFLKNDLS